MKISEKTLNCVKSITAQAITNAKSGHLGASLGISAFMLALFKNHYNFDVSDTDFLNRDRLVLSVGHACPVYYTLLNLFGFDVSLQDLKEMRTCGSKTPGHPEYKVTDGVEATTGPLGQGVANAVGMAIAQEMLAERFNAIGFPIINNYTYCVVGDGCLMEGVAQEACSLAGNLNLKKLILLYDSNDVTMEGNITLSNKENVAKKFKAMGWNVIKVKNGNNFSACSKAIGKAKKSDKPCIIIFKTTIGIGTDKEGTSACHSGVLSEEELKIFNKKLGVSENFFVPNDVRDWCMASARKGQLEHEKWNQELAIYANSNPELYRQFTVFFDRKKIDFDKLTRNSYKWEELNARDLNKTILNEMADKYLQIVGGCADVVNSSKAFIDNGGYFTSVNKRGRNIHFGVREHAMAGICNGIALYEDFIPFCSTFLAFSNYMMPAIRLSAMMKLNVIYIFTHDSVKIGQDGATHQPIEQIAQLRQIPGLTVFRPCDCNELLACYQFALANNGPVAIVLPKDKLEPVDGKFKETLFGGYLLSSGKKEAKVTLIASGSEVQLALNIKAELDKKIDCNVVSVPCITLFDQQSTLYKSKVLGRGLKVCLEASNDNMWYKFLNDNDFAVLVNEYQKSGKGEQVYKEAGFDVKNIIKSILRKLAK